MVKAQLLRAALLMASLGAAPLFIPVAGALASPKGVDLRGYGVVQASIAPDRSVFKCESPQKADILLGKLLADMFWDAGNSVTVKTAAAGGRTVTVREWQPYGDAIAARAGSTVVVLGGDDEQGALRLAAREPLLRTAGVAYAPLKPYPNYLDYYDLDASKCATLGLHIENDFKYEARSAFMKKFFPGGYFGCSFYCRTAAEGAGASASVLDTDFALADQDKLPYSLSLSTGEWPLWAVDKWPADIDRSSQDQEPQLSVFGPPEALGLSGQTRRETSLKFIDEVLARYGDNPEMAGYELYCGDYGCETYFNPAFHGHLGYTPEGLDAFRTWLRKDQGLTLASLGDRWYGDPNRFKTWDEVPLADPDDFFGDLNEDCLRVDTGWSWKSASAGETAPPADGAAGWAKVDMPPSPVNLFLPQGASFWRLRFDPSDWPGRHPGKDAYLVVTVDSAPWQMTGIWLNGAPVTRPQIRATAFTAPFAVNLSGLLKSGDNEVDLQLAGGSVCGPSFLTTEQPAAYPYLGEHGNARYLDCMQWRLSALNDKVRDTMAHVRSLDPNRPFVICATNAEVKNGQGDYLREFGGSMQDTGYEASFRPTNSRLGYAGGFYGSCESSGTGGAMDPDPTGFETTAARRLGWTLFNGEGMYKELRDPYVYYGVEQKTGWFTKNHRKYQLMGKYLPVKPQIALLYSSLSALLDPGDNAVWNLERGELEASHYDNVDVTEHMVEQGLASDYPVLIDGNSRYIAPSTLAAIRKYVERGGTFIALQSTGQNGLLKPDTWPIESLTGFKAVAEGKTGNIRFGQSLPIFKGWEGREFPGEGSALDWKKTQVATGACVALEPQSPDTLALARWSDGTVAVGMRTLGKGRVIVLGSTFWRDCRDAESRGMWRVGAIEPEFFHRLFSDLGVERTADASTQNVYAREVATKNGLQTWLIAMNTAASDQSAGLGFAVAEKPAAVWDMNDGSSVPFTYDNGWVRLNNVSMSPFETKIYGVKRATLSQGVDFWWSEKTRFWTRRAETPPEADPPAASASDPPTLVFGRWKFLADVDGSVSKGNDWLAGSFDDKSWRAADDRPWNLQYADLKDYAGIGLYRSEPFSVPSAWAGKPVSIDGDGLLNYCWRSCDLYLNGQPLEHFLTPDLKYDVTSILKPAGNVLCVKLLGRPTDGAHPISGLFGSVVWMQPEITLDPSESLLGTWQAVQGDWSTSAPAEIAGVVPRLTEDGRLKNNVPSTAGNHFVRDVDIPAAWSGRNVYLRLVTPQMNTQQTGMMQGVVLINDHARELYKMPNRPLNETIDITPFIKYGQVNRIELWPRSAVFGGMTDASLVVNDLAVGCAVR